MIYRGSDVGGAPSSCVHARDAVLSFLCACVKHDFFLQSVPPSTGGSGSRVPPGTNSRRESEARPTSADGAVPLARRRTPRRARARSQAVEATTSPSVMAEGQAKTKRGRGGERGRTGRAALTAAMPAALRVRSWLLEPRCGPLGAAGRRAAWRRRGPVATLPATQLVPLLDAGAVLQRPCAAGRRAAPRRRTAHRRGASQCLPRSRLPEPCCGTPLRC